MNFWEYLNRRASRRDTLIRAPRVRQDTGFWRRVLSPMTARFILALLSLAASASATFWLMSRTIEVELKEVVVFALGQMFALTTMAFGYYFGSTARGDERPMETHITNKGTDAVPVEDVSDGQQA